VETTETENANTDTLSQSVRRPSLRPSVNQPTNQPTNQPINQSEQD